MSLSNFPLNGLGTYKLMGKTCTEAVLFALEKNIKLIDTASFYKNESEIGKAIDLSNVKRESFALTTKVWTDEMRTEKAKDSLHRSLEKLKTDYVDYYLIHWPVENKWLNSYEELLILKEEGLIKNVGVCNFTQAHLEQAFQNFKSYPALNQVEAHPTFQQKEMQSFCKANNIQMQSWRTLMFGEIEKLPTLHKIAAKHNKSIYQIALRFFTQQNIGVIPKSASPKRILENNDIKDFELDKEDLNALNKLDANNRTGPHPNNFDF